MSKICPECGFENDDAEVVCAMCMALLGKEENDNRDGGKTAISRENEMQIVEYDNRTVSQDSTSVLKMGKQYFVNCENSRTKTIVSDANITSFYCPGCKETHQIDGFFWSVQEESVQETNAENGLNKTSNGAIPADELKQEEGMLSLEDVDTHYVIKVGTEGGVLGRYGTLGSVYFQNDPRGRKVSGEHCRIKYEYGRWSIEHLSRTNDTVYAGRKMEHGYEEALRDGRTVVLANTFTFLIRIS